MFKKIKIHFQVLALALLPAFIMRPVVVAVHNGSTLSVSQQEARFSASVSQQLSAPHSALRNVEREAPDVTALVPRISKAKAPLLLETPLNVVFTSAVSSPKSFLVLRI
jgi:hypothetical protein